MPHNTQYPTFLKPEPKPPVEPPRRPARKCRDWSDYRKARTRATGSPGPATDADAKGALAFAQDMDSDIAAVYYEDLRR